MSGRWCRRFDGRWSWRWWTDWWRGRRLFREVLLEGVLNLFGDVVCQGCAKFIPDLLQGLLIVTVLLGMS